jgi:hypothetical protein
VWHRCVLVAVKRLRWPSRWSEFRSEPSGFGVGVVWAPGLLVVGAGTRGVGYFSSGKNNSLRSDIFFPARKIPHTPLPTCSTGIPRGKNKCSYLANTRQCPSARGGCWVFCRKKMSERSELFFQKNPTATPQACPHIRKAGRPSPSPSPMTRNQERVDPSHEP